MVEPTQLLLIITICLALSYAFANGLNDAANALATVVATRVLTPLMAVILGGSMNMVGALSGTAVAKTIGKGIVDPEFMTQAAVMAAILAAVIWVVSATRLGLPVSVSHSLVAGVTGSGLAVAGPSKISQEVVTKVLLALALSPVMGFAAAFIIMLGFWWLLRNRTLKNVNRFFSKAQILSAALLSYSHGKNDAQNAIGIMALAWAVYASQDVIVHPWMQITSGVAIGLGTALGGWRVIQTLGAKVTRLNPVSGFSANTAAASVIEIASNIGLPVSTTHTTTSAILGVGLTRGVSAVHWKIVREIIGAWVITYPACSALGWVLGKFLNAVI
jgi:PiT family inorganic phosphate transporter